MCVYANFAYACEIMTFIVTITVDVNECTLNIDNCDQRCVNDFGSYHCECYSGYLRGNNLLSCIG